MGFRDRYNDGYGMGYVDGKKHYDYLILTSRHGGEPEYHPPGFLHLILIIIYFVGFYGFYHFIEFLDASILWMVLAPFWPLIVLFFILFSLVDAILDVLFGINITFFGIRA